MRRIAALALALCCLGLGRQAAAQETVNTGSVSGRVTDEQGGTIPGTEVTARDIDTNVSSSTTTDHDGRFRFAYLKVGRYEIVARLSGFHDAKRSVTLLAGSAFDLPITLKIAPLSEEITLDGDTSLVTLEAARSQIAGTVTDTEVKSMPLNGRNTLDLALLVPGVSPTNVGSTQLFAETSASPGPGVSVGSQRNFSTTFIVDGLSGNDDASGLSGMTYGVDAVDQFQVVTSGGQAELGRALGGYVSIVTKSGTNVTHGDAYGFFRDDAFNSPNALLLASGKSPDDATLPMSQQQFGGSLGGAIAQNRTFYFANVEERRLDQTGLVTILPAAVTAINATLAASGYGGAPVATGIYPNPLNSTNVLGKIDHATSTSDRLSVRYSLYHVTSDNSRGAGGLNAPSASAGLDNTDQAIAVSNTLVLTNRLVNETRAQMAYSTLSAPPTDPIGPAVAISGVASFGTLSVSPTARVNTLGEVIDNLSYFVGTHSLRTGVDFLYNDDTITFPRSNRGAYTFSSLQNFLAGVYNNAGFTQTFGATAVTQTNPNVGTYVQDEWRVRGDLTINAGVRYDLQYLETIQTDTNNVAPRLGLTWLPGPDHKTLVRASAGRFFDRIPLRALANALLSADNTTDLSRLQQTNVSLSPAQAAAPAFPNILAGPVPLVTLVNFTTMDPHMQNAWSDQASVEIEREISEHFTVSGGYQYVRGRDLIIQVNQNVPSCVAVGTNNGCRPNSTYANNNQYSPLASSTYHGLHVSLLQRPSRLGYFRVSYTLSKAMDNVGQFFFSSPIDPFDLSKDWGRSDNDQRHRLVVSGAINSSMEPPSTAWQRITHGFQLSGQLQYYSALPFNITSGLTTVQGTAGRPIVDGQFIPRNSGIGPDFFSLNLRLSRTFRLSNRARLEALVEAFNLTNRTNVVTVNGNFGAGAYPASPALTFGQPTAVSDPRSFQLGFRLRF
jgi:hypothetical protein